MNRMTLASLSLASFLCAAPALAGGNACSCSGDLDGDALVNGADFGLLLGAWNGPDGDLDGNGTTDGADLGALLAAWGPCPVGVNDSCDSAQFIPVAVGAIEIPFCTYGATMDGPTPPAGTCNTGTTPIYNDVWFEYHAVSDGELTLSTCSAANFDTIIAVYSAIVPGASVCPPSDGSASLATFIGCNDDGSPCPDTTSYLEVNLVAGHHYKIRLGGFFPISEGTGTLSFTFVSEGAACFNAIDAGDDATATVKGSTLDNPEGPTPFCLSPGNVGPTEWIVWTAPCDGFVTMKTCNATTDFDTVLAVYRETFDGGCTGIEVDCNDDSTSLECNLSGPGSKSKLEFFADQGTTYYIQVTGFTGDAGAYELNISQDCL